MTTMRAQYGEDRILKTIFQQIGVTTRCAVEFGALDGVQSSNTAWLRLKHDWRVVLFDVAPLAPIVIPEKITAENINAVFAAHDIPQIFDLLSIDIDGMDLWVWKALRYQPRVVVIEYNPRWGTAKSFTVPYDPDRLWDHTDYYGASVRALWRLGQEKGYDLVASTASNLIFVRAGLLPSLAPARVACSSRRKRRDRERAWVAYP